MRLLFTRAFIFAFVAAVLIAPLTTRAATESHVWIENVTNNYVWVSAFMHECPDSAPHSTKPLLGCTDRYIVHEWCVPPGAQERTINKQGFHVALTVVHVLVTAHPNCGRPILKDWTETFPRNIGKQSITQHYRIDSRLYNGVTSYVLQNIR